MIRTSLLAASLMLPIMAIGTAAHAGPNASDKRYWPSEARVESPLSAYAMERRSFAPGSDRFQASKPQYRGGPKSGLTR
jgi:hypothetical protein